MLTLQDPHYRFSWLSTKFFFLIEVQLHSGSTFWYRCGQRWTGLKCIRACQQRMEAHHLVILGLKSFLNESLNFYFNILRLVRLNLLKISLLFSTKMEVSQQICFKLEFWNLFNLFSFIMSLHVRECKSAISVWTWKLLGISTKIQV